MTNKFMIECTNGAQTATILLTSSTMVLWNWECKEGEDVWGSPFKGTLGSNLVNGGGGTVPLGNAAATLDGFTNVSAGTTGTGDRIGNIGGSFPLGQFDWECIKAD